jgi:hypothetical protein
MSRRGAISLLIGCILGLGLVWIFQSNRQSEQPSPSPMVETGSPDTVRDLAPLSASEGMPRSPLADELNAPGSTAARDVRVLREIFMHWQTNLKSVGNPVGTNAEITGALTGNNPLKLAFVPPDHPAINDRGELCDRWGTPFRFHQLSGTVMEITSAGPDRRFATEDDSTAR